MLKELTHESLKSKEAIIATAALVGAAIGYFGVRSFFKYKANQAAAYKDVMPKAKEEPATTTE